MEGPILGGFNRFINFQWAMPTVIWGPGIIPLTIRAMSLKI